MQVTSFLLNALSEILPLYHVDNIPRWTEPILKMNTASVQMDSSRDRMPAEPTGNHNQRTGCCQHVRRDRDVLDVT